MKIRPVGAELFNADRQKDGRTDRQTDLTKLIVGFRNFAKAPKKLSEQKVGHICPFFSNSCLFSQSLGSIRRPQVYLDGKSDVR